MRWGELSGRDRRAVVAGGLVLLLGLSVRVGVLPYLERVGEARDRLAREQELLERERALLREARGYRATFDTLGARLLSTVPRLMKGGALASTQAELSSRVDAAAAAAPAQLSRVEALPPRPAGTGLLAIPLRVEGESDSEGLLTLLADLEAGPTLFHVADLDVRAREGAPLDPSGEGARPTVVAFRFTVTGFVLEEPAEASPSTPSADAADAADAADSVPRTGGGAR